MKKKVAHYTPGAAITVRGREQSVRAVHSGHASTIDAAYDEAADGTVMLGDVVAKIAETFRSAHILYEDADTWRDYADAAYRARQTAGYLLAFADRIGAAHPPEPDER